MKAGFTLVEVVVMIFITALIMLGMLTLFDWHNRVYYLEQAEVQATGSARTVMNHLDEYVGLSHRVVANHTFSGITYSSGPGTIVLEVPSINNANEVIADTYDYVAYYATGSQLYEIVEANPSSSRGSSTKQLSTTVNSISYTYNNADFAQVKLVTVDLRNRALAHNSPVNVHLNQAIFLHNY